MWRESGKALPPRGTSKLREEQSRSAYGRRKLWTCGILSRNRAISISMLGVEAPISDRRQAPVRAYLVRNSATSCLTKLLSHSIFPASPNSPAAKCAKFSISARQLLFVATDRISAFDLHPARSDSAQRRGPESISAFWFQRFGFVENHVVAADFAIFPRNCSLMRDRLAGAR